MRSKSLRSCHVPLIDKHETIGNVVRSHTEVKPAYVSVGYKVDLQAGIEYVPACCRGFRLPKTTRIVHRLAIFAKF